MLRSAKPSGPLPCRVAIHIGYHKTATKWFQRIAFQNHPQIFPYLGDSARKLIVSDDFLEQIIFVPDLDFDPRIARATFVERARSLVTGPHDLVVVSAERLSGHAASGGYDSVRIADRLMATLPEALLFWFLRHQSEAIRSEYKQLVRAGWTGKVSKTMDSAVRRRTTGFDLAYWEYDRLVAGYVARFGQEKVHVLDYGAFTRDRSKSLHEIAAFLGIDEWKLDGEALIQRVNVSKSDREMRIRQVLNYCTKSEFNPYPIFEIPPRWRTWVIKKNILLPDSYRLFDSSFDDWVETRYRDSNRKMLESWQVQLTRSAAP